MLTSNTSWCGYYQRLSQNVQDVGYCDISTANRQSATAAIPAPITSWVHLTRLPVCADAPEGRIPITEQTCTGNGGVWMTRKALGGDEPDCRLAGLARCVLHVGERVGVDVCVGVGVGGCGCGCGHV